MSTRVSAAIVTLVLMGACAKQGTQPPSGPPPSTAPDEVTVEALGQLAVTSAQKAEIDGLRDELVAAFEPTADARVQFTTDVLAAIEAGATDASLEHSRQAVVDAFEATKPTLIELANQLHALLTPAQRNALIDTIEERATASKDKSQNRELADSLNLSFAQKRELYRRAKSTGQTLKAEAEALRAQLEAAGEAFRGEDFDAATLELASAPLIDVWTRHAIALIEEFMPILDADQRKLLAEAMRSKL